jgi:hypothetical protein
MLTETLLKWLGDGSVTYPAVMRTALLHIKTVLSYKDKLDVETPVPPALTEAVHYMTKPLQPDAAVGSLETEIRRRRRQPCAGLLVGC